MDGGFSGPNTSAGSNLSSLFLNNQSAPHIVTAPAAAPQSMITPDMFNMQAPPPIAPPAPQPAPQPTAYNFGWGGGDFDNTAHPFAQGNFGAAGLGPGAYVKPPAPAAPKTPFQMPQTALIAQAINKKYARK